MTAHEQDALPFTDTPEDSPAGTRTADGGGGAAALPFERYQRLHLAADVLDRLFAGREAVRVLELCKGGPGLEAFLAPGAFTIERSAAMDELPFEDDAFDAVVTCDALCAVPVARREAVAAEVARVARHAALIVGAFQDSHPCAIEASDAAPATPGARADLERPLTARGFEAVTLGHGSLERALAVCAVARDAAPAELERWRREFNELLYQEPATPPFLRHALLAFGSGVQRAWLDALDECQEGAEPRERLSVRFGGAPEPEPPTAAAEELAAAQAESVAQARQHEAHSAALRRERDAFENEAAELRAALLWERNHARRENEQLRTELERDHAERDAERNSVDRKLEALRRDAERERDRANDLDQRLAARDRFLDAEAARHRAQLAEVEEDRRLHLEATAAEREELGARLQRASAENEALREELRGFGRNLRRAFLGPR